MENNGTAIVVGVVDANGRRIVSYGSLAKNDNRKLDGDTVFEIGSMTKVFTSLLFIYMARHGQVALTDPISKYPDSVKVPERNGRKITLADLSTQSSSLPRMPNNFAPKDPDNPYADYTVPQRYEFLSGYQLTRDIGSQYEYSNLGVGLLGHPDRTGASGCAGGECAGRLLRRESMWFGGGLRAGSDRCHKVALSCPVRHGNSGRRPHQHEHADRQRCRSGGLRRATSDYPGLDQVNAFVAFQSPGTRPVGGDRNREWPSHQYGRAGFPVKHRGGVALPRTAAHASS